jgi:hypothetical protein
VVSVWHNLGKFPNLNRRSVYSNGVLSVWWLQVVEMMYSNQELADMHVMYNLVDSNSVVVRHLYQERYPGWRCLDGKTFLHIHHRLCEHGNFAPHVAKRGWPRSTTPEVQKDILDVVNETPGISTRRESMQVGVAHSTVWRVLQEQQLYPYHLQSVQALSLQDYPAWVMFCQWFLE